MRFLPIPDDIFSEDVRLEIKRFMCSLEAYKRSANPKIPIPVLVKGVLDKEFASRLKKFRDYTFMKSSGLFPYEEWDTEEFYEFDTTTFVGDIGQIFNYSYCFFWEEDDVDDIAYSQVEVDEPGYEIKNEFCTRLRELLEPIDNIEEVPKEEVFLSISGSVCKDDEKYVYAAKEQEKNNTFSNSPLEGKRSIIRVSPANVRDSIILSTSQSNTVKWIELNCKAIAQKISGSAYVEDNEEFNEIVDEFYDKFEYFLDRDFKKEGLTKPRYLLELTLGVLAEEYPHIEAFKFAGIYKGFSYIDFDGEKKSTRRGHGLGMANALTTIIQSVLFSMIVNRLSEVYRVVDDNVGCVIFNDDFTAGFKEEFLLEEYWDFEDVLFSQMGIIRNKKKSRRGRNSMSFCERYYPAQFNEKSSYKLNELFITFTMPNISLAKVMFNNFSRVRDIPYTKERVLRELIQYFGIEFFSGEETLPFTFGGWVTPSFNNVDLSNYVLTRNDIEKKPLYEALMASEVTLYNDRRIPGEVYNAPIYSITRTRDIFIPEEFSFLTMTNKSKNDVRNMFGNRNNSRHLYNSMVNYSKRRHAKFKLSQAQRYKNRNLSDLYILQNKMNPLLDILPHESIMRKVSLKREFCEPEKLPKVYTKMLSLVEYFNPGKTHNKKILPLIYHMDETLKKGKAPIKEGMYNSCDVFRLESELEIQNEFDLRDIVLPKNLKDESHYLNPELVVESYFYASGNLNYPDVNFKEELSRFKYKDDPKLLEIIKDPFSKSILMKLLDTNSLKDSVNKVIFLLENYDLIEFKQDEPPEPPEELTPSESSEEDSPKEEVYGLFDYPLWRANNAPQHSGVNILFPDIFKILDKGLNYHRFMSDFDEHEAFLLTQEESEKIEPFEDLLRISGVRIAKDPDTNLISRVWIFDESTYSGSEESEEGFNADDFLDTDFG